MRYTKSDASEFACFGVDLNRNFDFKWMGKHLNSLNNSFFLQEK